jgi:hypothetical protein
MSNGNLYDNAATRLAAQSDAIAKLAQDNGGFAAAVAAFESKDPDAFRWVLGRVELVPRCELICEWIRIKLTVLRCIEVCGIPREKVAPPDLNQFARVVIQVASNEKCMRRLVDAVSCGNAEDYQATIAEFRLEEFCHPICYWIGSIVFRRICEIVCVPERVLVPDAISDIRATARVLTEVIANEKAFAAINRAAITFDCERLRDVIEEAGFGRGCEIICRVICIWRCIWVCRELCLIPPVILTGAHAIEEARNFALASRQLANQPRVLADLVSAVQNRDVKQYEEIIARFGLGPYCGQVCAWVCSVTCFEFCACVCPNPALQPWFTTVGYFDITSDIDPGTGKTNKGLPPASLGYSGGPNFAFTGALQLGGFCPYDSPTTSGVAMKYRFLYAIGGGSQLPITGNLVSPVEAGTRLINWPQNNLGVAGPALVSTFQTVTIASAPTPAEPTPPATGAAWYGPSAHYITPDADGWVAVDANAIGGGFQVLLGFDTTQPQVVPGGPAVSGVAAGTAVPVANQKGGTDMSIIFQATRVTTMPPGTTPDFTNPLNKIHINNWVEVNELWFQEFGTDCCTGIDASLNVQFTVDHEEMDAGAWSLVITSCSPSAPGDITPAVSGPGITIGPRGGSGTVVEDTSLWSFCSYTATLTTRPGLTTGLVDRGPESNPLTFCICGH